MSTIGGIILAAGSSSRMGTTKQLLQIGGRTLVRRAVDAAKGGGLDPVVVVTGAMAESVERETEGLGVRVAFNPDWSAGMGTSIQRGLAGLLEADGEVAGAAILVCDQPALDAGVIRGLLETFARSGKSMAACEYGGTIGVPCCFDRSMFSKLQAMADGEGAKSLPMAAGAEAVLFSWPAGADDVDTPGDWEKLTQKRGLGDAIT